MSANVYWQPTKIKYELGVMTPSRFKTAMTSVFGQLPWELDTGAIIFLKAMIAVCNENSSGPYIRLVEAIEKHDSIRVWMEH